MIRGKAFARAGWLGNPSDGFGGKTISFSIGQFAASVELESSPSLEIVPGENDIDQFRSLSDLVHRVEQQGYYGAQRLIKAAIKRFYQLLHGQSNLDWSRNFRLTYQSDIPRAVGLAGSSAIVVATLRALEQFYGCQIPQPVLPSLALSVEVDELGIPAGLQDRVIQCYQGLVWMDFQEDECATQMGLRTGNYQTLNRPTLFDEVYISFGDEAGQPTEVLHSDLRQRFDQGDSQVTEAMKQFANFAALGKQAVEEEDRGELNRLINANFDLRQAICPLHATHVSMVETARSCGASAKYCGSGGAIVGLCEERDFPKLAEAMKKIGCKTIRPEFVPTWEGA